MEADARELCLLLVSPIGKEKKSNREKADQEIKADQENGKEEKKH